jgi:hypothetical protein
MAPGQLKEEGDAPEGLTSPSAEGTRKVADLEAHRSGTAGEVVEALTSPEQTLESTFKRYKRQVGGYIKALRSEVLFKQEHPAIVGKIRRMEMDKLALKAVLSGDTMNAAQKMEYLLAMEHEVNRGIVNQIGGVLLRRLNPIKTARKTGWDYYKMSISSDYVRAIEEEKYSQETRFNERENFIHGKVWDKTTSPHEYLTSQARRYEQGKTRDNREGKIAPILRFVTKTMGRLIRSQDAASTEEAA